MWEHRCKVAVSGVGFSKITRSAEIPLATHALEIGGASRYGHPEGPGRPEP